LDEEAQDLAKAEGAAKLRSEQNEWSKELLSAMQKAREDKDVQVRFLFFRCHVPSAMVECVY